MKIKKYSKGKHTYTQLGKTKKVEKQNSQKIVLIFNDKTKEIYSNKCEIEYKNEKFIIHFFKKLFPDNKQKLQGTFILDYKTIKNLENKLKKYFSGA